MTKHFSLVFLLLTTPANVAVAQDADAQARERFASAEQLIAAGRFDEAYQHLEAGYELSSRPLFLFNMGECALQAGHLDRARVDYERYLREDPQGRMASSAQQRLTELNARLNLSALLPDAAETPPRRSNRSRRIAILSSVGAVVAAGIVTSAVLATRGGSGCSAQAGCFDLRRAQ